MTFGLNVSPAACIWVPLMQRARDRLQRLADLFNRFAAAALAAATNRGERATKPGPAPPEPARRAASCARCMARCLPRRGGKRSVAAGVALAPPNAVRDGRGDGERALSFRRTRGVSSTGRGRSRLAAGSGRRRRFRAIPPCGAASVAIPSPRGPQAPVAKGGVRYEGGGVAGRQAGLRRLRLRTPLRWVATRGARTSRGVPLLPRRGGFGRRRSLCGRCSFSVAAYAAPTRGQWSGRREQAATAAAGRIGGRCAAR